jgi:hypothetical protein
VAEVVVAEVEAAAEVVEEEAVVVAAGEAAVDDAKPGGRRSRLKTANYRERVMLNLKKSSVPRLAKSSWHTSSVMGFALFSALLIASIAICAESATQQNFPTAASAAKALVDAARSDNMTALTSILGSDAKEVLYSGDPVADNNARDDFVAKYDQMHRLAFDAQGRVILYIGADNWPFSIPLIKENEGWKFDTQAGDDEQLFRRIGRNELYTIDVLADLADAQQEYASEIGANGGVKQFAQKIQSDTGKRNGLYWQVSAGEEESPIGPLIAEATKQGYKTGTTAPVPFHGYYYRILTRQGQNAPGGAIDYLDQGKMTKSFAFLAYPANYRASGVMTFMINQNGVIVQKDLGSDTAKVAVKIAEYNPDKSWDEVND